MKRFFNEPIMVDWCGDKCFPVVLIGTETMGGFEDGLPVTGGLIETKSHQLRDAFNKRIGELNLPKLKTLRGKVAVCNVARKVESNIPLEVNPEDYKADQIFGDAKEGEEDHVSVYKKIIFNGEWILSKLLEGKCVYVHCNAGASRSPTVVAKVIMNYLGESVQEAEERMKKYAPKMNGDDRINIGNFRDLLINGNDLLMRAIEEELALPEPELEPEQALEPEPQLEEDNIDTLVEEINEYLKNRGEDVGGPEPIVAKDMNTVKYMYRESGKQYSENVNIPMNDFFQFMARELEKGRGDGEPNYVYLGDGLNWFKEDGSPRRYIYMGYPFHNTILLYIWIIKNIDRLKSLGINGIALEFIHNPNVNPPGRPVKLGNEMIYTTTGLYESTNVGKIGTMLIERLLKILKDTLEKNGIKLLPAEWQRSRSGGGLHEFNNPRTIKGMMESVDPRLLIILGSAYMSEVKGQDHLLTIHNVPLFSKTQIDEFKQKLSELESTREMILGMGQGYQVDTKDIDADILRLTTTIQKATENMVQNPSNSSEKKKISESIKHKEQTLQMFMQEGIPTDQLIKEIDTLTSRLQTMQGGRNRRRRKRFTRKS